jgi:hypothetical protein
VLSNSPGPNGSCAMGVSDKLDLVWPKLGYHHRPGQQSPNLDRARKYLADVSQWLRMRRPIASCRRGRRRRLTARPEPSVLPKAKTVDRWHHPGEQLTGAEHRIASPSEIDRRPASRFLDLLHQGQADPCGHPQRGKRHTASAPAATQLRGEAKQFWRGRVNHRAGPLAFRYLAVAPASGPRARPQGDGMNTGRRVASSEGQRRRAPSPCMTSASNRRP